MKGHTFSAVRPSCSPAADPARPPPPDRHQRDGTWVDHTGLHHLVNAAAAMIPPCSFDCSPTFAWVVMHS